MNDVTAVTPFPEARVLVVEDDEQVRAVLVRSLTLLGYHVAEAASGQEALEMLKRTPYDVAVLDIRLPDIDGVEVMHRATRVRPDLAIIFLTAYPSLESTIAAVKSHAADYLVKPAGIQELATAVASALQRRTRGGQPRASDPERFLEAGPVTLDRERRLAVVVAADGAGGFSATLSRSETALLAHLMQHPAVVLSCQELVRAALGYDMDEEEARGIIRPHICRLRKKIESDPDQPCLVLTALDRGYLFSP